MFDEQTADFNYHFPTPRDLQPQGQLRVSRVGKTYIYHGISIVVTGEYPLGLRIGLINMPWVTTFLSYSELFNNGRPLHG